MNEKFDIAIIGAGMVGLVLAAALHDSNLQIVIIDRNLPAAEFSQQTIDLRVSAITAASKTFLQELNVWSLLPQERIGVFHNMYVWDSLGGGEINFVDDVMAKKQLGYIVENSALTTALYKKIQHVSNIKIIAPAKLQKIVIDSQAVKIYLDNDEQLTAKLIVGADGADSVVREQLNIKTSKKNYSQSAVVANVVTEIPHRNVARQCFLPQGPLAFLPLQGECKSSIVWSTSPEEAEELIGLDEETFKQKLTEKFSYKLGKIIHVSVRKSFPLRKQHAEKYVLPRAVLIGDAAHTIHPLAGQGVNLGLLDAECLAKNILLALKNKRDFSGFSVLRRYERERKSDNALMLQFVDGIQKLFCNENTALVYARSIGFNLVNQNSLLKDFFLKQASGYR